MKLMKLALSVCALGLLAGGALAQDQPGTIAGIESQTPKNGMVKQYEEGRKAKAAWQRQQNDKTPLLVSEILTGERTGTYNVGQFSMHWADFDKPSVPDAADVEEYNKVVAPYVEKRVTAYYEFLPKWSNPSTDMNPKYITVVTFSIRYGKGDDFASAVAKVQEANRKLNTPVHNSWFRMVNGGRGGTYVLVTNHADWASFEANPAVKPLRDRLREAFGEEEAASIFERLDNSVEHTYSELIQTRPDLSYIPAK
jgi:hypothetical protein